MKKIGIMYGVERSFPAALEEYVNEQGVEVKAESVIIGAARIDEVFKYDAIFDRVSQDVPFFRSVLKSAALGCVRVVNNPYLSCVDDNFFHASIAARNEVNTPRTVVLPSKEHPSGVNSDFMNNLQFPIDWDSVFEYVGFPAYLKPNAGSGIYSAYKIYNPTEFFSTYDLTGNRVMILQEAIDYEEYYRCVSVGYNRVRVMKYDPRKPLHMRYSDDEPKIKAPLKNHMTSVAKKVSKMIGFEINIVEFAVRDGKAYVTEFLNSTPNAEKEILREHNFNWLVENCGDYLIELALSKNDVSDYCWTPFFKANKPRKPRKKATPAKK